MPLGNDPQLARDPGLHPMGVALRMAATIRDSDPARYVMPNQYDNADNAPAHHESTGPEIWAQTEGRVQYFFAGFGTCGPLVGTGAVVFTLVLELSTIFVPSMQHDTPPPRSGVSCSARITPVRASHVHSLQHSHADERREHEQHSPPEKARPHRQRIGNHGR